MATSPCPAQQWHLASECSKPSARRKGWTPGLGPLERQVQPGYISGESDPTVCHHLELKSGTLALHQIIEFAGERNYLVEILFLRVCCRASHIGGVEP